ncbi:NAC domain-containing protein 104-like isoform X2 [Glycine soja]|uniref:NAC domain-containing protein n=2 Tax=Glycine subgen. Soja TaxID=1462606 RepID=A0A0R0JP43_SOYBN|nr:NAC domain-containing protein 104 isoform X2 [Glycine max]XP_028236442.1 NAC domain-containing protein 104-like isoform X2 [Glycine soja]RZC07687.1 NAC domain-containing protein 104 isoform C [Glycine soja]|eukprot:XP_014631959.1 NAC domain-containing protein 104 isoform X2 [Glycine max]
MEDESINLPPGFLFSPTDEELVVHFLYCKALLSGNQYYFFTKVNENRTTENGYWKDTGVTKPILSTFDKEVGMKKYLVFHIGEAPQGTETSWVMQEYHICSSEFDTASYRSVRRRRKHDQSWSKCVLCRVYEKIRSQQSVDCYRDDDDDGSGSELSWLDEVYLSLDDDLKEIGMPI